jgi:hypothetical protein
MLPWLAALTFCICHPPFHHEVECRSQKLFTRSCNVYRVDGAERDRVNRKRLTVNAANRLADRLDAVWYCPESAREPKTCPASPELPR